MLVESPAFVLRTYALGEADRIVVLFSRSEGKLRGVAPRGASSRKRFGGTLSLLAQVEVCFRHREGRELGRLESCRLLDPTPGEGRDLEVFYACAYVAELLEHFSREGEGDEHLYRLTAAVGKALDAGIDPYLMARYFEVWTLRLGGFLPAMSACGRCGRNLTGTGLVLLPGGEATCHRCAGNTPGAVQLDPAALSLVLQMLGRPPDGLGTELPLRDLRAIATAMAAQFLTIVERPFRAVSWVVPRRRQVEAPVSR